MTGHETMASRGQAAHSPDPKPTSTLEELRIAQAKLKAVEALTETWLDDASAWYYENRHTHAYGSTYVSGFDDGWEHARDLLLRTLDES